MAGVEDFREGLRSIFNAWSNLKIAVENGAGGRSRLEKAQWLPSAVADWILENEDVDAEDIEDIISEILDHEFKLVIDDDSLPQLSSSVFRCYELYREGKYKEIETEFYNLQAEPVRVQRDASDDDDDDSETEEELNPGQPTHSLVTCPVDVSTMTSSASNGSKAVQTEDKVEPMEQDEEEGGGWQKVKRGKGRQK